MFCLTGDIHHKGLGTGNQRHSDISELEAARRFLGILEERDIKVTFFLSGMCFAAEWPETKTVTEHPLVEWGGHNFSCMTPELPHRVWNKLTGNYNGPAWYQRLDAEATKWIMRWRTGKTPMLWRNHMYMHGPNTERVLAAAGMRAVSDGVDKMSRGPVMHPSGILSWPINVIPDHEHIYHAERTPEWVEWWVARYDWSDDFGPQSYSIEQWTELVLEQLRAHAAAGRIANLIVHPITMYLADNFRSFERIADYLADRHCVHMSEICDEMARQVPAACELPESVGA